MATEPVLSLQPSVIQVELEFHSNVSCSVQASKALFSPITTLPVFGSKSSARPSTQTQRSSPYRSEWPKMKRSGSAQGPALGLTWSFEIAPCRQSLIRSWAPAYNLWDCARCSISALLLGLRLSSLELELSTSYPWKSERTPLSASGRRF